MTTRVQADQESRLAPSGYCDFCDEFVHDRPSAFLSAFGVPSDGRVVLETTSFLVIVDVSPVTVGHLLIIPRAHALSMSTLPATTELQDLLARITSAYANEFGGLTVIEHGSCADASGDSSCVDHAHWHLLPFGRESLALVTSDFPEMRQLATLGSIVGADPTKPYVLVSSGGEHWMLSVDEMPSHQYARSVALRILGDEEPSHWDWSSNPQPELLSTTLRRARQALSHL